MSPRVLGRPARFTRVGQSAVHLAACAVALYPCAAHGPPLAAHLCVTPLAIISWLSTIGTQRKSLGCCQPPVQFSQEWRLIFSRKFHADWGAQDLGLILCPTQDMARARSCAWFWHRIKYAQDLGIELHEYPTLEGEIGKAVSLLCVSLS